MLPPCSGPTFIQGWLFYGLCAVGAASFCGLLYLLRSRQATLRRAERVDERERIARALHDTFLQNVQGLILNFQSALMDLPADSPTRRKMERVLTLADRVMEEGRDQLHDLRSTAMRDGDLNHALSVIGEVLQESHAGMFSLRTEGRPIALSRELCEDVYHIGREALMNAFRHAGAGSIVVTLAFSAAMFELHVSDNGQGMSDDVLEDGRRQGHWGLPGMFERAGRIGAVLDIDSTPGGGTCIALRIPGGLAYAKPSGWRAWYCRAALLLQPRRA